MDGWRIAGHQRRDRTIDGALTRELALARKRLRGYRNAEVTGVVRGHFYLRLGQSLGDRLLDGCLS